MQCKIACAYEQYDSETLIPSNESSLIRLSELEWTSEIFIGKSVLDIGCNAGLLSIYCKRLGASKIISVDATQQYCEYFRKIVANHNLDIIVQNKSLFELDSNSDSCDIVLFMEVLHWIVQQGNSIGKAISKVASLTNETLYIETPYDVNEPSIKAQAKYTEAEYSLELIFKELNKYFHDIKVLKFMTYFGEMKSSKRILIKATNKRVYIPALQSISNCNFFNFKLPGNNYSNIIFTLEGPKILKESNLSSAFANFDFPLQNCIIEELKSIEGPLVLPDKINNSYTLICDTKQKFMIFPFRGNLYELCGYKKTYNFSSRRNEIFQAVISCSRQMQSINQSTIYKIREQISRREPIKITDFSDNYLEHFSKHNLKQLLYDVNLFFENGYDAKLESCLIHDDLQLGNFVVDQNDTIHIVDIDNIRTGTIYSDIISHCIYVGATYDELLGNLKYYADMVGQIYPDVFDFQFSLIGIFKWMQIIDANGIDCQSNLVKNATAGLQSINMYMVNTLQSDLNILHPGELK